MGMSSHVVGFRPADDRWDEMKAIWTSCHRANIRVPDVVDKFFDGESPIGKPGMEVEIKEAVERFNEESREGFTVDLKKLPNDVTFIRFFNSY